MVNNTALVFLGQPAGITLKGIRNITVEHSTVSFVPYAGIKVGWQSVGDTDAAHGAIGVADPIFVVENNVVSDYGLGVRELCRGGDCVVVVTGGGVCGRRW